MHLQEQTNSKKSKPNFKRAQELLYLKSGHKNYRFLYRRPLKAMDGSHFKAGPCDINRITSFLLLIIPAFFFRKCILITYQSRSVVRPSITFLVNVSPPKPSDVATSNFVAELVT